jgi:hypothetical protein
LDFGLSNVVNKKQPGCCCCCDDDDGARLMHERDSFTVRGCISIAFDVSY